MPALPSTACSRCPERLIAALVLGLALGPAAAETTVQVERAQGGLRVSASVPVAAPVSVAWAVLTDFEKLHEFVYGMISSHVVSGPGEPLALRQRGSAQFLLWTFPMDVTMVLEPNPMKELRFHAVAGNLPDFRGTWRLEARPEGTLLNYQASFTPDFWVPPLIGPGMVASQMRDRLDALAEEMERRAGRRAAP